MNMFFKRKEGSRTRGHKAALGKIQCRLDMRKYSFSDRVINEWYKLSNDPLAIWNLLFGMAILFNLVKYPSR